MQTFEQREIEFRAWDKDEKKMYHWNDKFFSHMSPVTGYGLEFPAVQNMILMQYTGIKDKNGKKIFEGDIVLMLKSVHILEIVVEIVRYDTENAGYSPLTGSFLDIEVAGNFFENEELIKWEGKFIVNNLKRI